MTPRYKCKCGAEMKYDADCEMYRCTVCEEVLIKCAIEDHPEAVKEKGFESYNPITPEKVKEIRAKLDATIEIATKSCLGHIMDEITYGSVVVDIEEMAAILARILDNCTMKGLARKRREQHRMASRVILEMIALRLGRDIKCKMIHEPAPITLDKIVVDIKVWGGGHDV